MRRRVQRTRLAGLYPRGGGRTINLSTLSESITAKYY
jgi:hypothetical protein